MTDPLALAEEIEESADRFDQQLVYSGDARLLAAALRLASATSENFCNLGGRVTPKMIDAEAAFRAAKEAT